RIWNPKKQLWNRCPSPNTGTRCRAPPDTRRQKVPTRTRMTKGEARKNGSSKKASTRQSTTKCSKPPKLPRKKITKGAKHANGGSRSTQLIRRTNTMLQSIKHLYGNKLGASDGDIGHVKDFYFDDQNWVIRYLVADTGTWLPGRRVLLAPHAFGSLHQDGKVLCANLTRKQIEDGPSIEAHKPVSRQYEEEYYRYYGWPYYWQGDGLWGLSGFPILELPAKTLPDEPATASGRLPDRADAHLRSTQAVGGYHLQASD